MSQPNRMPAHEALSYLAQIASDYIATLPASAAGPTGAVAQQALDALRPLVIGPVSNEPQLAEPEGERA